MAGDFKLNIVDDSAGDAETIREEIMATAVNIQIDWWQHHFTNLIVSDQEISPCGRFWPSEQRIPVVGT